MQLPLPLTSPTGGTVISMADYARAIGRPDGRTYMTPPWHNGGYQQRWGSTLTPLLLTAACRNADLGYMTPFCDLLDELRETDPHLHAVLGKREWSVAGADWEVRPAAVYESGVEPDEARVVRNFCTNVLRAIPNLPDRLSDLLGGVYYGRSALEVVWDTSAGYSWPTQLIPVHPRLIQYGPDWRMYLYADPITSWSGFPFGPWPGKALADFPSGKFIVHTPRIRGGFASREGLGRPVSWFAMFKRWVIRDGLGLAEMAGRLARIGEYSTGQKGANRASDEDIQVLRDALDGWNSSNALVHPDTTKVTFEKPVTGDTIHSPLLETFNAEISKAVLGETLTTEAGSRGARSLGEVHAQQGRMIAKYDAVALAETIRRCLIAPLVQYNFGADVPVPRLAFSVEPPESLDGMASRLEKLVKVGLKVGQGWTRDQFGITDPGPDEELLGAPVPVLYPSVADTEALPSVEATMSARRRTFPRRRR